MDEIINSNNAYAVTFNYHPAETQFFEDTLTFLISSIKKCDAYAYVIEKDDTPYRHLHIFLSHSTIKEKQKVIQKIMNKKIKHITSLCKYTQFSTDYSDKAIQIKQLKDLQDKLAFIGYIFKENPSRQDSNIICQDFITMCVKTYYAHARLDNTCEEGWKPLTSRNFHDRIEQFCKKQNYDVNQSSLYYDLIRSRHTFLNLSSKQVKMGIAELKFAHELDDPDDISIIDNYCQDKSPDDYVTELEQKLKWCQNLIREKVPELPESRWYLQ